MCASKGTVPVTRPCDLQNAAYQRLTDPVAMQNLYRQLLGPTLGSDVAAPLIKPSPPQDPVDPVDARFRGLILEEEKKT